MRWIDRNKDIQDSMCPWCKGAGCTVCCGSGFKGLDTNYHVVLDIPGLAEYREMLADDEDEVMDISELTFESNLESFINVPDEPDLKILGSSYKENKVVLAIDNNFKDLMRRAADSTASDVDDYQDNLDFFFDDIMDVSECFETVGVS